MTQVDWLALVVAWLDQELPGVRVVTKLPADSRLREVVPVVRVRRTPGGQTTHAGETTVLFDVDWFDLDQEVLWATVTATTEALVDLSARWFEGALVDDVKTHSGPGEATWADPDLYRVFGIYQLTSRS